MFGMLARLETYHGVGCLTDTEDLGWWQWGASSWLPSSAPARFISAVQLYSAVHCGAVHCTVLQPLSVSERLSSDRTASERFTIFSAPTKYFCGGSDLCERSACTCLATWAGWGSTRPPRPPTGPPASVCLSMLLLTLFSISTGRTTAFCRGFLADIHIEWHLATGSGDVSHCLMITQSSTKSVLIVTSFKTN